MAVLIKASAFHLAGSAFTGSTYPASVSGYTDIGDGISELSFESEQNQQDITNIKQGSRKRINTMSDYSLEFTCPVDNASGSDWSTLNSWFQANDNHSEDRHCQIVFDGTPDLKLDAILLPETRSLEFSEDHELTESFTLQASGGLASRYS